MISASAVASKAVATAAVAVAATAASSSSSTGSNNSPTKKASQQQPPLLLLRRRLSASFVEVIASPDGIVSIYDTRALLAHDKKIQLCPLALVPPPRSARSFARCCFTPDGSKIIAVTEDKDLSVLVIDVESGALLGSMRGHKKIVIGIACADVKLPIAADPSETAAAAASKAKSSDDVEAEQQQQQHQRFERRTLACSTSQDKSALLFDVCTMKQYGKALVGHTDTVLGAAFSPDGSLLSTYCATELKIWSVATQEQIADREHVFRVLGAVMQCVCWDLPCPSPASLSSPVSASCSGPPPILFVADSKGRVHRLDVTKGAFIGEPIKASLEAVAYSGLAIALDSKRSRKLLAVASRDGRGITLWDITNHASGVPPTALTKVENSNKSGQKVVGFVGHTDIMRAVKFYQHCDQAQSLSLLSLSRDNTVRIWDVESQTERYPALEAVNAWDLALSPPPQPVQQDRTAASMSQAPLLLLPFDKSGLGIHSICFGACVARVNMKKTVTALAFSQDGKQVEVTLADNSKKSIPLNVDNFDPATIPAAFQQQQELGEHQCGNDDVKAAAAAANTKKAARQQEQQQQQQRREQETAAQTAAASDELTEQDLADIPSFFKKLPARFIFEQSDLEVTAPIASGGMGSVLRGKIKSLDWPIAAKVFRDKSEQRRAMKECWNSVRLRHRNIVQSLGVCAANSFAGQELILIMELGDESLEQFLKNAFTSAASSSSTSSRPSVLRILSYAKQLCEAVAYLHHRGMLWLDCKPSNILLCGGKEKQLLKICDLGISHYSSTLKQQKRQEQEGGEEASGVADATHTCVTQGGAMTLRFAPPEQRDSSAVRPQNDVYSIGATLFYAITGKPPFFECENNLGRILQANLIDSLTEENLLPEYQISGNTNNTNSNSNSGIDALNGETTESAELRKQKCGQLEAATKLVEVTRRCLQVDYRQRPRDALELLEMLLDESEMVPQELQRRRNPMMEQSSNLMTQIRAASSLNVNSFDGGATSMLQTGVIPGVTMTMQ